jgi:hypothetical protein
MIINVAGYRIVPPPVYFTPYPVAPPESAGDTVYFIPYRALLRCLSAGF